MSFHTHYRRCLSVRYRHRLVSKSSLFYLLCIICDTFIPLLIVYNSDGFWRKVEFFREQPDINFSHKLISIIHLRDSSPETKFWSTFSHLNRVFGSNQLAVPSITNREIDEDLDSKFERLDLSLDIPIARTEDVTGVQLILFFDYKLNTKIDFQTESILNIEYHNTKAGNELRVVSNLVFNQKQPLVYRKRYRGHRSDALDSQLFFIEDLLESDVRLNFSTSLDSNTYYEWHPKTRDSNRFRLRTSIGYAEQLFEYRPGVWYVLKWALIQYTTAFLIVYLIVDQIKAFVYENRLLDCIQTNPLINE